MKGAEMNQDRISERANGLCECGCGQALGFGHAGQPVLYHVGGGDTDRDWIYLRRDCHEREAALGYPNRAAWLLALRQDEPRGREEPGTTDETMDEN